MCGPMKEARGKQQTRLLPAGEIGRLRICQMSTKSKRPELRPPLGFGRLAHQRTDVIVRAFGRVQFIELVLGEIGHIQPLVMSHEAAGHGKAARQQFCEGRFAITVGAEQSDPVIRIKPQVEIAQDRRAVAISKPGCLRT